MNVYINEPVNLKRGTCLALGSFDALHKAHLKLINTAVSLSQKNGLVSGVYSFLQRPVKNTDLNSNSAVLYTNEHRIKILEKTDVDFAYFEDFNEEFMHMPAEAFIKMLKQKFNIEYVVVGFHYRFGYKAAADAEDLRKFGKKYGFGVEIISPVKEDNILISSTYIRNLVANGEVERTAEFLGRKYSIYSKIDHGRKVGTNVLNIPTANFHTDKNLVLPSNGVYACFVKIDKRPYAAVTNIGTRPTFNLNEISIESHILDFDGDLYDEKLELFFIKKLRNEKKFENSEQLRVQILSDIDKARNLFNEIYKNN